MSQKHKKGLVKNLIAKNLSNIVICGIDIEKNSIPLNKGEKALRNDFIKMGIPGDNLEKLLQEMQSLKLDFPEDNKGRDHKKKRFKNLKIKKALLGRAFLL